MANPVYDIAAISTNVSGDPAVIYTVTTLTQTTGALRGIGLISAMANVLTSAGWTTVTSSTTTYEAYGVQSPWFDTDNVPSWYTQNIPWVRFNAGSLVIGMASGQWNGTAGTNTNTSTMTASIGGANEIWHTVANPFQFAFTGASNGHGFLFSALHVPDFVQERVQIKNCMFSLAGANAFTSSFNMDNQTSWTLYESNLGGGVQMWTGDPNVGLVMVQQIGGGQRQAALTGSYVWNPVDTAMTTSSIWYPLMCPPTVAWVAGTSNPSTTTNTPTAMGMLWDAVFVNQRYTRLSTATGLPEIPISERRNWIVYGVDNSEYTNSLLFVTEVTP